MRRRATADPLRRLPPARCQRGGEIRYQRDAATQARDGVTQWSPVRTLVPARSVRRSWDYQEVHALIADEPTALDQGASGNALAAALSDRQIEMPHAGDTFADHARLTRLRMQRHEFEGSRIQGMSGVRDLAAGEWNRVASHSSLDGLRDDQREYLMVECAIKPRTTCPSSSTSGRRACWRAARGWPAGAARCTLRARTALCEPLRRGRAWHADATVVEPRRDLPPTPPLTAIVVGPANEDVHCDALGRVKVQFQGLDPVDHAHAQGAGTDGSERGSAWVRVNFGWAGAGFGNIQPLRWGMEVEVSFLGGDPDRPLITGVLYNARQTPPRFSRAGTLPGNRYLSGTRTHEVRGELANQLRFDDTPGRSARNWRASMGRASSISAF